MSLAGHITAHIACSDDHHVFPDLGAVLPALAQEINGRYHPFLSRNRQDARFVCPYSNDHKVVVRLQLLEIISSEALVKMDMGKGFSNPFEFGVQDRFRNAGLGNGGCELAPQGFFHIKDNRLMTLLAKLPCY